MLTELGAGWLSGQSVTVDYRPCIAELEKQRSNLIEAIKAAGLAAELGEELKAVVGAGAAPITRFPRALRPQHPLRRWAISRPFDLARLLWQQPSERIGSADMSV